jgi:hypothetical protein
MGITDVVSDEANSTFTASLSALTNSSFLAFKPILALSTFGFSTLVPNADETNFTDAIVARPTRQNKASQIVLNIGVHPDSLESHGCGRLRPRHGCPSGLLAISTETRRWLRFKGAADLPFLTAVFEPVWSI